MRRFVLVIMAFLFTAAWTLPATASPGSSATLQVRAVIRPWIKFSASQPIASYQVTSTDISRGYVDLPQAVTLHVATNIRDAVKFAINSNGPERILVRSGGATLTDEVSVEAPLVAAPVTRTFDMRILLPDGTKEGSYPLQLAMSPVAY